MCPKFYYCVILILFSPYCENSSNVNRASNEYKINDNNHRRQNIIKCFDSPKSTLYNLKENGMSFRLFKNYADRNKINEVHQYRPNHHKIVKYPHRFLKKISNIPYIKMKYICRLHNLRVHRRRSRFVPQDVDSIIKLLCNKLFKNVYNPEDSCPNYINLLRDERTFYSVTFKKLIKVNSKIRRENGISFVNSGLFLHLTLLALSTAFDEVTTNKIDAVLGFNCTAKMKTTVIKKLMETLPLPSKHLQLQLYSSSRLVLSPNIKIKSNTATNALKMQIQYLNNTNDLAKTFNTMVKDDSHGVIRKSFNEDDFKGEIQAVLLSTVYFRSQWKTSPILLNNSLPFYIGVPRGSNTSYYTRSIRINDVVGYANLQEWDAEAIEIEYATRGLTFVAVVPKGTSLTTLVKHMVASGAEYVTNRLRKRRIGVTMPIYTLRMTLFLPNKLKAMGLSSLLTTTEATGKVNSSSDNNELRISHAFQRVMFWAEAGRNAFKDDGLQWDEVPEMEFLIDRPYIFYVKWKGITVLNGNFAL